MLRSFVLAAAAVLALPGVAQAKAAGLPLDAAMNPDKSPSDKATKGADEAAGKVSDEG